MCPRLGKLVDARRLRLVELLAPLLHLLALVGLQEGNQVLHVAWLLEDQVGQDGLEDVLPAHPESSSCLKIHHDGSQEFGLTSPCSLVSSTVVSSSTSSLPLSYFVGPKSLEKVLMRTERKQI